MGAERDLSTDDDDGGRTRLTVKVTMEGSSSFSRYAGDEDADFEASLLELDDVKRQSTPEDDAVRNKRALDDDESNEGDREPEYLNHSMYEPTGFGEFSKYMRNKRKKLQVQNKALLEEDDAVRFPQIFKGLAIYVNGYTETMGLRQMTEMLVRHGGVYVPYLDKKALVTHIIATTLTPSKREEFKSYKVAKPSWLLDSVKDGKLLDWRRYALLAVDSSANERPRIGDADEAPLQGTQVAQRSLFAMTQKRPELKEDVPRKDVKGKGKQKEATETHESLAERGMRLAREAIAQSKNTTSVSTSAAQSFFKPPPPRQEAPKVDDTSTSVPISPTKRTDRPTTDSPGKPNVDFSSYLPSKARSERTNALLSDADWLAKHTSTADDFLETYFGNSRLHHLSTWKEELKAYVAGLQVDDKKPIRKKKLTGTPEDKRTVFHVDFDCFFVSAGLTKRPELRGKPVAVCHGGKGEGVASTSEIASCSYEARAKGVKNGISLGRAREMCPEIQTIPFEFDLYKSIAEKFYRILLANADFLEARSVDEVLMEISTPEPSPSGSVDPALDIAHRLRAEIKEATGCEASIGISHNILLARLATRRAKPASAYHLLADDVTDFLRDLPVGDLPGIGWSTEAKLVEELHVETVGELLKVNKSHVQSVLGKQNGAKFHAFAEGIDPTELANTALRQSVSAEVNYGIRFTDNAQVEKFLRLLAVEVAHRLQAIGSKSRFLNLKVMVRHPEAPVETPKFLGHGWCNTLNASSTISGSNRKATDDGVIVGEVAWKLMQSLMLPAHELRGIGLGLSKLEKDGVPVDIVREAGQGTLSWGASKARLPQTKAVTPPLPPPAQQPKKKAGTVVILSSPPPKDAVPVSKTRSGRALRAEASVIILDDESKSIPTRPVPREEKAKKEPKPKKVKIAPLFKSMKKGAMVDMEVTDADLEYLGIDVEFFRNIPREDQSAVLTAQRAKTLPKLKEQTPVIDEERPRVKEEAVKVAVVPPSPESMTDEQIKALGFQIEDFRALPSEVQLELVQQKRLFIVKGVVPSKRVRKGERRPAIVEDIPITKPATFNGKTSIDDLRKDAEEWVKEFTTGPADADVSKFAKYLFRLADPERGQDLDKISSLLAWIKEVVRLECDEAGATAWSGAIEKARKVVDETVQREWTDVKLVWM